MAATNKSKQQKQVKFLDKLRQAVAAGVSETGKKAKEARSKLKDFISKVSDIGANGNDLLSDKNRLRNPPMKPLYLGKLVMYYYDPKWKAELKYYDRFPLIIPLEIYNDGWLGANLHYLPPGHRAVLMDMLFKDAMYQPKSKISDTRRIQMTYQKLKAISSNNFYKPCIKRYLYKSAKGTHLKSRFYLVPIEDWDSVIFMPYARFEKANERTVHSDSLKIIAGQRVDMRDTKMRRNIRRRRAYRQAKKG